MATPVDTSDKQVQCRRAPKFWHSENTSFVIKQLIFGTKPIRRKVQLIHVKRRCLYRNNSPPPCFPNNCAPTISHVFTGDDGKWRSGFLGGDIFQPVSMDFSVNQHFSPDVTLPSCFVQMIQHLQRKSFFEEPENIIAVVRNLSTAIQNLIPCAISARSYYYCFLTEEIKYEGDL